MLCAAACAGEMLVSTISEFYDDPRNRAGVVDLCQKLGMLPEMLAEQPFHLDLHVLAAQHGHLRLSDWLREQASGPNADALVQVPPPPPPLWHTPPHTHTHTHTVVSTHALCSAFAPVIVVRPCTAHEHAAEMPLAKSICIWRSSCAQACSCHCQHFSGESEMPWLQVCKPCFHCRCCKRRWKPGSKSFILSSPPGQGLMCLKAC